MVLSIWTSCGLSGWGEPALVIDEHRDAVARGGSRVDPGKGRAVGGDERVGAVAADAEHRRALDDVDADGGRQLRGDHCTSSTHGSASTRLWMAAPLIVKMLSSGTSAAMLTTATWWSAASTGPSRSPGEPDVDGHLTHLEGRQRQDEHEQRHLHRQRCDRDDASPLHRVCGVQRAPGGVRAGPVATVGDRLRGEAFRRVPGLTAS